MMFMMMTHWFGRIARNARRTPQRKPSRGEAGPARDASASAREALDGENGVLR
jgi:hypothetical protein